MVEKLNLQKFFNACNPSHTLNLRNQEDQAYYIDFATVRGGKIIEVLKRTIARLSPEQPTCQLFTGHIGCGKSTELSRLAEELTQAGFHVVYFASSEDLDEIDIDFTDIMLAIARRVTESLEKSEVYLESKGFKSFLKSAWDVLQTPVTLEAEIAAFGGKGKIDTEGKAEFSLPLGLATITAKAQGNPSQRSKLRQYLEPRSNQVLELINQEIIAVANQQLKQGGKSGLVVIVDNLDRIDSRPNVGGRPLPEYIFIDRGDQLRKLNCHLVYTIPLGLMFSNENEILKNRLGGGIDPKVLPMVTVRKREGFPHQEGMNLLRQMVLSKAFPELDSSTRLGLIHEIFDSPETLDRLCQVSGGHLRNLTGILYSCLQDDDPPISRQVLESVIRRYRDRLVGAIDNDEWDLLFKVFQEQKVKGDREYQIFLKNLWVFEYRDDQGNWFSLNPLLQESEKFKKWQENQVKL